MNKWNTFHKVSARIFSLVLILSWNSTVQAFIHTESTTHLLDIEKPITGLLHFSTENYISRTNDNGVTYWPYLEADGAWTLSSESFRTSGQGKVFLPFVSKEPSVEFAEVYIGTPADIKPLQLYIGRKMESWSALDDYWKLGMFQPRFRMNYLEPDQAGLLGGFLKYESEHLSVIHFISPFFIPDRGVPTQICGGWVCSNSPWFISPSHKIQILNTDTPIVYRLDLPPISEVVTHPGTSLVVRGHGENMWVSGTYSYKPINQLLLAYDAGLMAPSSVPIVPVAIHPRVLYHHIAAIDMGMQTSRWNLSLSGIAEWPMQDTTSEEWVTQQIQNTLLFSPKIEYSMGDRRESLSFDLSYLKQWGGEAPVKNPYETAAKSDQIFEPRNSFTEAVQVGLGFPMAMVLGRSARPFYFSYRLLYDFAHSGSIISTDLEFRPMRHLVFSLGADFLSSYTADGQSGNANDFISRYQSNDRVHFGVTYVF